MNARRLRLTACGVTALLVLLVPLAAAEGEYWKEPDTVTFPGGGSVAAGRVENLLEQDGRTMKLADSIHGTVPDTFVWGHAIADTLIGQPHDWTANLPDCPASTSLRWTCVDDVPDAHDSNATFFYRQNGDSPGNETISISALPVNSTRVSFHTVIANTQPNASNVRVSLIYHNPFSDTNSTCFSMNITASSGGFPPAVFSWVGWPSGGGFWQIAGYPGLPDCNGTAWNATVLSNLLVNARYHAYPDGGSIWMTSLAVAGARGGNPDIRLGADLRVPSTGYYPIRAEWTCTARTGGPYYLGALNTTGSTRWFNVTRDAGGSYPSGEMCAVPGATERYHATMTAADFGADGRVHFRVSDNSSDPSGSAWGNITLDRLVAILTQDFGVSVGNLGWLVYLGFITVGILIAAFAYHRWREHGSGA